MSVEQRWPKVEQPILKALAVADGEKMNDHELQAATGIELPRLVRALRSLKEDDYITGSLMEVGEEDGPVGADGIRLLPKGLRRAGLWPASDDLGEAFLAALENAIQNAPEGEERTKLERVLAAAKVVGGMALSAAVGQAVGIGIGHM